MGLTRLRFPTENQHDGSDHSVAAILAPMKVADLLRMLHEDGWVVVATRGSHRQFKHASKAGRVTVPGKPSDDVAPGTLSSVLKQAGLKR